MSIGPSLDQIAEPQIDPATGKRPPIADVRSQPNWLSGGGGMVSTASDYVRFSQMLLNGGELDGVRLLSPHVVAYMTSDQLPPDILFEPLAFAPTPRNGASFGLGFAVRTQRGRSAVPGEPGKFTWGGIWGTAFLVDPQEKLVAVLMLQVPALQAPHYQLLLHNLAYQALVN